MSHRDQDESQVIAAAKAGMSERTGRRIETGECDAKYTPRQYSTREDPLAGVWESELAPMLENQPQLKPGTLFRELQKKHPGKYQHSVKRTLQRRVQKWKAMHGGDKEVIFPQKHEPGVLGLSDFTTLKDVTITIRGVEFEHLLYHFRLQYSGYCYAKVVQGGESFTALSEGLQNALWALGGCPEEHRTDSLSAAYKNRSRAVRDDFTVRYHGLCLHYGLEATRNNKGVAHENGGIESPHGHLKGRIKQELLMRESNDFDSVEIYQEWIDGITAALNLERADKIDEESAYLKPLPKSRTEDYEALSLNVPNTATISIKLAIYSVPSKLIGSRLRIHLYGDRVEAYLGTDKVFETKRVFPQPGKRRARCIDYRHLIGSLKKKPMAFRRYEFRDEMLPTLAYQDIWHWLCDQQPPQSATKIMVGILALAAEHDCQAELEQTLLELRRQGKLPILTELQNRFAPPPAATIEPDVTQHSLDGYDAFIDAEGVTP